MMLRVRELHGLFDLPEVLVLAAPNDEAALGLLTAAEAAVVARAVDKRKREFATGRALARLAMARLGLPEVEIPCGADRAPVWPPELAASISHCDSSCVVAMGLRARVGTLGIDVEHRARLERALWETVFLRAEIDALEREHADATERGRMALVRFSAKEALYKAQYPWSGRFMGFHELRVDLGRDGTFRCEFQNDVGPFRRGTAVTGRYRVGALDGGEIVTAVRIAAP